MTLKNIKNAKCFWIFFLISSCIWITSLLIRLFCISSQDLQPLLELSKAHQDPTINKLIHLLNNGNKFSAFIFVFWNNLKVCIFCIAGGVTLNILTIVTLAQNGFFTADIIMNSYENGISVNELLKHTLPHSFEIVGIWLSGAIGFCFTKILVDYITNEKAPKKKFIRLLNYQFLLIFVITLAAALIETYVSIPL